MDDADRLAERFDAARPRLRRMSIRMLGSAAEADDALQESWFRIARAGTARVENIEGWLTTVVARVCLDALQRRKSRREDLMPDDPRNVLASEAPGERPEDEAVLADSIGTALAILLDALPPAERVAYVLHDMFDVPFDDVASVLGRTTEAARQLASRARRRVRGVSGGRDVVIQRRDELVRAFLTASRAGNFSALLRLLDPAATLRADATVMAMGGAAYWGNAHLHAGVRGAAEVAQTFLRRARAAVPVFIGGEPGAAWFHDGALRVAFRFRIVEDRITAIELVADADALERAAVEPATP